MGVGMGERQCWPRLLSSLPPSLSSAFPRFRAPGNYASRLALRAAALPAGKRSSPAGCSGQATPSSDCISRRAPRRRARPRPTPPGPARAGAPEPQPESEREEIETRGERGGRGARRRWRRRRRRRSGGGERVTMEDEEELRAASAEEPHDERREVPSLPERDPALAPSQAPLPSAIILRALQQAVGGSLQGELSNEKDVPRARGPRRKRCRSPRAELCLRGAGGTDAAAVVDLAARSFLAGLMGVLEPPDSWIQGRLDLPDVEEEPAEMLELVAEVHLGDGAPLSVPISHPLHRSWAWRASKSGSLLQPGFLGPSSASSRPPLLTLGTGDGGPAPPPAPSSTSSSPSSSPRSSSSYSTTGKIDEQSLSNEPRDKN
uniref:Uncharacterized protein n=1 Tax=Monodelphis domestica TaxID=13616 RepID=F6T9K5_MONDO